MAFSDGLSVAVSKGFSLFNGIWQRIVTCPVDLYLDFPVDFQWHFPMESNCCAFWCVIFCPDKGRRRDGPRSRPQAGPGEVRARAVIPITLTLMPVSVKKHSSGEEDP